MPEIRDLTSRPPPAASAASKSSAFSETTAAGPGPSTTSDFGARDPPLCFFRRPPAAARSARRFCKFDQQIAVGAGRSSNQELDRLHGKSVTEGQDRLPRRSSRASVSPSDAGTRRRFRVADRLIAGPFPGPVRPVAFVPPGRKHGRIQSGQADRCDQRGRTRPRPFRGRPTGRRHGRDARARRRCKGCHGISSFASR